jgi:hypothetical protein
VIPTGYNRKKSEMPAETGISLLKTLPFVEEKFCWIM